jgi:hypothetical protein
VPILCAEGARSGALRVGGARYIATTLFGPWHLGHLWFLANLLAYACAYAAWRHLGGERSGAARPVPLRNRRIVAFTLGLALVTFAIRVRFQIDQWIPLLGVLPVEPAHAARDTAFFAVGTLANRARWLESTPPRMGAAWLAVALAGASLCFVLPLWSAGGANLASLRWSTLETVLCTGFCLGVTTVIRDRIPQPGPLLRWAIPRAYGAYIAHPGPVLALQLLLARTTLPALVKFALVSLGAVPLSFLLGATSRRRLPSVPGAA